MTGGEAQATGGGPMIVAPERTAPITGSMITATDGIDDLPATRGCPRV